VELQAMTYSATWLRLCEAEQVYLARQYESIQNKEALALDLHKALAEDNFTALRLLAALKPGVELVAPLLPRVLDIALDSNSPDRIGLARTVLVQYKDDPWVRNTIQTLVGNYLPINDEWHYRRLAELYTELRYQEELTTFLALCQTSDNAEIKEVGDDFSRL
jgi:hypothetical protein